MKVSIIIPVYNCKQYLGKCINSVKVQTYRDWECIIVDDASTDGSAELLDNLTRGDNRFVLVLKKRNAGVSAARNAGIKAAKGESIFFLDGDDWLDPGILQYLVTQAEMHPEAGRIVGPAYVEWERHGWHLPWSITPKGLHAPNSPDLFSGPDCDPGHVTGSLYVLGRIPCRLKFPGVSLFEDMIFNMTLMFAGVSTYITDKYLYHYVRREGSLISAGLSEKMADMTRKALWDAAKRHKPSVEVYVRCSAFLNNAIAGKLKKI